MLGQPIPLLIPQVIGVRLTGSLRAGATATDLVLTVTEILRKLGVVGSSSNSSALASRNCRSRIARPLPTWRRIWRHLRDVSHRRRNPGLLAFLGPVQESIALVEAYCREQGLFATADAPEAQYTKVVELDMASIEPCVAGPRRRRNGCRCPDQEVV